ncbi:histidine phosphatase superfamily [Fusarium sp. MPI-SDFR-AT-0072]|nr:histidine phosphatase superfamily [Fusarium sp. MPI-SDFR-AT-0072]
MSQKPKHIVTIGGSFASVRTAHKFLQGMQNKNAGPYKVTMISRDSHFFWNLAMPRAIIPGTITDDQIFQAIAPGFAKYGDKFELIVGTATGIDINNQQVKVYKAGRETFISYDYLLIGTGSSTKAESPFKSRGSTDATRDYVHAYQKRVGEAHSIIVAGAGPTGVEVAGELADYYGDKKEITLVNAGPTVLDNRPDSVSKSAHSQLEKLGVKIRLNTKLNESITLHNGKQEVTFSSGEKVVTDLVIPTFGVVPNSSFVPPDLLDAHGYIKVNQYLAIEGREDVFAIGDVSNVEAPQFWFVNTQAGHMAKNLAKIMLRKPMIPYKASTTALPAIAVASVIQQPIDSFDHTQGYQFDPLLHLPGISPYFDAVGFGLSHAAPEGCTVTAASYLIRHAAIYANDAEYEDYIKPFLYKLEKHRGDFSGPLEFLNKWYSPIEENHLEDVTPSGKVDAKKVGHHLVKRYRHLASSVKRVIADTKDRTYDTAKAFLQAFPEDGSIEITRFDKKELNNGTRALLPHKACSKFSKSPGTEQQQKFVKNYASGVAKRLRPYTPDDYELAPYDVFALQSICGYESAIRGKKSPICGLFSDAEWLSYEYAWDMKYAHMVGPFNPLSNYLGFPWLHSQSKLFSKIDENSELIGDESSGWPKEQRLFFYFTHREVPPFVATALGIFNSSSREGYDEFPTTHVNHVRAWKMSDLIPFLGHVGMEKMTCKRPVAKDGTSEKEEFIRFIANTAPRPLPLCQNGPGASCPFEEFKKIVSAGMEKYGDFDGVCENKQGKDDEL